MVFAILLIFLYLFIYLSFDYKNKFTWIFSIYTLGIGLLTFSVLLYTAKLMNYQTAINFDYYLYVLLNNIKCNITDAARIYNIGMASIMIASTCTTCMIKKYTWKKIFAMLVPIVIYLFITDPSTEYELFLMLNSPEEYSAEYVALMIRAKQTFTNCAFSVYLLLPFYYLYIYYRDTQLKLKKTHAVITAICIFLLEIFVVIIVTMSPIGNLPNDIDLLKFPIAYSDWGYTGTEIVVAFSLLLVSMYLVKIFRPFSANDILKKNTIIKNGKMLSKNLKLLFHVYKNSFLAVSKLAKQADLYIDRDISVTRGNLDFIQKKSEEAVTSIGHIIDILVDDNNIFLKKDRAASNLFDIEKCVSLAISKVQMPGNIKLNIMYSDDDNAIYGDFFHLTEAFVNLVHNAVEAIASIKEPCMNVTIRSEDEWVIVEIEDNGYGISKENLKYIFQPLYSTKHSLSNWGVGLAYVRKVIKAHLGYIYVDSEEGVYTKFQILLPHAMHKEEKENYFGRIIRIIKKEK